MKKGYLILLLVLILSICITSITTAEKGFKSNVPSIIDNQLVYNNTNLTNTSNTKLFPILSPNADKIAFISISNDSEQKFDDIGIINLDTNEIKYINLENIFYTSILTLEWLNSEDISFEGHVNPSLNVYLTVNTSSCKIDRKYNGLGFKWDKSKSCIYYVLPQPYFSDKLGEDKIIFGEDVIYVSDSDNIILGQLAFTEDEQSFAFLERNTSNDEVSLIVAEKNKDSKLEKIKSIKWDMERGNIEISKDGIINMKAKEKNIKYNYNTETLINIEEIKE